MKSPEITEAIKQNLIAVLDNIKPGPRVLNLRRAGFKVKVDHMRYPDDDARVVLAETKRRGQPANDQRYLASYYELRKNRTATTGPLGSYISAKGGATHVSFITPGDNQEFKATATCCLMDAYNRAGGVQMCFRRIFENMLKHYGVTKGEVKQWSLEAELHSDTYDRMALA